MRDGTQIGTRTWLAVTGCALLAMLAAQTSPAQAAFPGKNGKLAFSGTVAGQFGVHTINPDGTGTALLIRERQTPAWSPTGTRIAHQRTLLEVTNADGLNPQVWYAAGSILYAIDWAPDESRLALTEQDPTDFEFTRLFSIAAQPNPTGATINTNVWPSALAWSPDGSRIAFIDGWQIPVGGIQTVATDGTGLMTVPNTQAVTPVHSGGVLDWSPDAQQLAFTGKADGAWGIFTIKLDGTGLTRVTSAPAGLTDVAPAWSPDGTKLAFVRWPEPGSSASVPRELFVVPTTGGIPTKLTGADDVVDPMQIDWQPLPGPKLGDYKNRAHFCKAERAFWGDDFAERHGGGANAFGKCVSGK